MQRIHRIDVGDAAVCLVVVLTITSIVAGGVAASSAGGVAASTAGGVAASTAGGMAGSTAGGVAASTAGDVAASPASSTPPPDVYGVLQGDDCVDVAPVSGSQTVESFYDYRNPFPNITGNPSASDYSSHGLAGYQAPQTSTMVLYRGTNGDSLVVVHGALDVESSGGSTTTFTFENLPGTGEWAVQDDEYPGRDDEWDVTATATTVTWFWAATRTDGGAYRGIGDATDPILIDAQFNEDAPAWDDTPSNVDPVTEMETWRVMGANGASVDLSMTESVRIVPGGCATLAPPTPSVTASPSETPRDRVVSFTAETSPTAVVPESAEYAWDFDGDGDVERVTSTPETEYTYANAGTYDASVRVRTAVGEGDPGTTTVRVGQSNEPAISVTGVDADAVVAGDPSGIEVTVVNDGGGDGEIDLVVETDDGTVGERTVAVDALSTRTVTVDATFPETGEYDVTVNDGASMEVEAVEAAPELAVTDLSAPERVGADQTVTVTATVENVGNADHEFDVDLELFGDVVDTRTVTVPDGETRTVDFDVSISAPGTYTARVGDATAELTVTATAPGTTGAPTTPANAERLDGFSGLTAVLALVSLTALVAALGVARFVADGRN